MGLKHTLDSKVQSQALSQLRGLPGVICRRYQNATERSRPVTVNPTIS